MEGGDGQWNLTGLFLYLQYVPTSDSALREDCAAMGIHVYLLTETLGGKFIFI